MEFSLKDGKCFDSFLKEHEIKVLSLTNNQVMVTDSDADSALGKITDSPAKSLKQRLDYLHQKIYETDTKQVFSEVLKSFAHVQTKSGNKKAFFKKGKFYLVTKHFTKGIEYVPENEKHRFKVEGKPLHIWVKKSDNTRTLEMNTLETDYCKLFDKNIVQPDKEFWVTPNTTYIVIAPTHTFFSKEIIPCESQPSVTSIPSSSANSLTTSGSNKLADAILPFGIPAQSRMTSNAIARQSILNPNSNTPGTSGTKRRGETDCQSPNVGAPVEDRASSGVGGISNGNDAYRIVDTPDCSNETETKTRDTHKRKSTLPDEIPNKKVFHQSPRTAYAHMPPNRHSHTNENTHLSEDERQGVHSRRSSFQDSPQQLGVFGIRKEAQIESYYLKESLSCFRIDSSGLPSGSFTVENRYMDPYEIQYEVKENRIVEKAVFNNNSTLETPLPITTELLVLLQKPEKRKEKIVVSYFFDTAFRNVEAAYNKFLEMKNMRMIGSCVPALVPMRGAKFSGSIPDTYQNM